MGIINKRLEATEKGEAKSDDLLGILLKSNSEEIKLHGNNKSLGMSIKKVTEECKLFYFDGQETSSIVLKWTMVLLSWHKNWKQKAREEVVHVFGEKTSSFDGLNHLKTVTSILYEVMHLYPKIVLMSRRTIEETKLGEITLPACVILSLPTILLHQDEELWGDNAKDFNPERFF